MPVETRCALVRARWATAAVFVLLGVVQGTLAGRMPDLKSRADLTDGLLGVALLGIPIGSLLAVQFSGRVIAAWGSSPVTRAAAFAMCLATAMPPLAGGLVGLLASMVAIGVALGLTDIAMNVHAVEVERRYGRRIMSTMHAYASLGSLVGVAAATVTIRAGVSTGAHFFGTAVVGGLVALAAGSLLLPGSVDRHARDAETGTVIVGRIPWSRTLVLLAATGLLGWMSEHAVGDWSAVYLRDALGAPSTVATYGFLLYAVGITSTRFIGDRVTNRIGPVAVVRAGGLLAGLGLAVGLLMGTAAGSIVGFGLVGVGMATVAPIVFSASGNIPGIDPGHAVSRVAGVAFTGSLLGPPLIGFVAELSSLRSGLLLVVVSCLLIALLGPRAVRPACVQR